jgi:hypothetical protein
MAGDVARQSAQVSPQDPQGFNSDLCDFSGAARDDIGH